MPSISDVIKSYQPDTNAYEELYKHFHSHPELSFQEKETAAAIVKHLQNLNAYEVHPNIGGYGVAAVLKNGPGITILLRADIDGLPVEEKSGVAYASKARMKDFEGVEKPTMHACGHDVHITSLLAAAETLAKAKEQWSGTLILCFQPAEERGAGAKAMVEDGLYDKVPEPDVVVGGHVTPLRAGVIGTKHGLMASSADSFELHIEGRQAHASTPHVGIDPIVQAASTILRLQTIVAREVDPSDFAVITVSAIHAGDKENIIPQEADLKLNVRAGVPETRERLLDSMKRIIDSEATASGSSFKPELTHFTTYPFLYNDSTVASKLEKTFAAHFGSSYNANIPRFSASEDFGILATSINKPSCFFLYGGLDTEVYDQAEKEGKLKELPGNHSPYFVPQIGSVWTGFEAYVVSALTFLDKEENVART
ncbi:metal-dependent amidase/aminoacylase/carboxypeptidase [Zopfia rhizophila CBS 207.26]|uniref:Metal-dependent amidase/aminoacylase/carboxypeptidase n=1 Tax=Zopfia rhizophila CBS 207.26 TaxID=1314779 RepID=A0A6A6DTB2_9PEZI|nr:metal-dependent amidase/aminoacylase/carboxypeptidase [Zopfia rhizophila CBS 207.26]